MMKEKELYVAPELEVNQFSVQDVITTSGAAQPSPTKPGVVLPDDEW